MVKLRRGSRTAKQSRIQENDWTESALIVLRERYLRKDVHGSAMETPRQLFERVASAVAMVEKPRVQEQFRDRFFESMLTGSFLPNSPTLMNAGKPEGQLSACFVLPISDSLESIFETLKQSAIIHQSGGGTGFSFSRVRPKGSLVRSTHGIASGPVSFIRIFDTATETVKQGGVRRGANMAVLRVDHPDVFEFVDSKRDLRSIGNFNISIGITEAFMDAVRTRSSFKLRSPQDGRIVREVDASDLMERIVSSAWSCGDPGLLFLDRINLFNPTPVHGPMEATNPCGEQPLLAYESCNLGSINLSKFQSGSTLDWDALGSLVDTAVRFLDNVVDANHYPVEACRRLTHANRKIGLGVMGFADLLLGLGISYDSDQARSLGEAVMSFIDRRGKSASMALAKQRGPFSKFSSSMWARLGFPELRNATVSTVAPTGTISMIAGCSSGIEPIFAASFERHVLDGKVLNEVHPSVERAFRAAGGAGALTEARLRSVLGDAWRTARDLSVDAHIRMQSVFQRHCDSAVSKTINLPESATREDVKRAYLQAYALGCKGITVYRDQSRPAQVLQAVRDESCEVCAD
jgi:ribonucleoside-diphosphate reductase alpha chain